jgi:hypothetical protein
VICKFCHFNFGDIALCDAHLALLRCEEHNTPICPKCFACQAKTPLIGFPVLLREAQRWRDVT